MEINEKLENAKINLIKAKSYIKRIKDNAMNAISIKEIAIRENTDYQIAKIMFNNGDRKISKEDAEKIFQNLKSHNIPMHLVGYLKRINFELENPSIDLEDLFVHISRYANKDIVHELADYAFMEIQFGSYIYDLMKLGLSIDQAIDLFDEKIKKEMELNGLSEMAAYLKLCCFHKNLEAIEYEKAYNENIAIEGQLINSIKARLLRSNEYKRTVVNDITLISKTEEGLRKLENLIYNVYKEGDKKFLETLTEYAGKYELSVTDFSLSNEKTSYYSFAYNNIFLSKRSVEKKDVFFHEATHFIDNIKGFSITGILGDYYSTNIQVVKSVLETIKKNVMVIPKAISLGYFNNLKSKKYVNDKELNQKWRMEITRKSVGLSEEDIELFMQQKIIYERKKYKCFAGYLTDIFDAITKGKLNSIAAVDGHGMKYYKNNEDKITTEFIANLGTIFNCGGIDFLYYEFGEELTNKIIEMYNNFMNYNDFNQEQIEEFSTETRSL